MVDANKYARKGGLHSQPTFFQFRQVNWRVAPANGALNALAMCGIDSEVSGSQGLVFRVAFRVSSPPEPGESPARPGLVFMHSQVHTLHLEVLPCL